MLKPNRVVTISNVDQVIRWWNLFKDGLDYCNNELKWKKEPGDFLKILLHIIALGPQDGFIAVLVSGGGQPYGFVVVVNNTNKFSKKTAHIYLMYSNSQCPSTVAELSAEAQAWSKNNNYEEVQACSYRFGGAALRWFQKKMGFTSKFIVFTKPL